MDPSVPILNRILLREESALLPYLRNAGPWVGGAATEAEQVIQRLIGEHLDACRQIAALVTKRKGVPASPRFPAEFSSIHFSALDHLLPWLVAYQKWLVETMEADLEALRDEESRALVQSTLELKRRHLRELETLTAAYAGSKAVSTRF